MKVLVFSSTKGFRHDSIEVGVQALKEIGTQNGFGADWTEDATQFTTETLAQYKVVVFLNTTGDVLNDTQQAAFEKFVQAGGGYVGIHSAADTEYGWEWYGRLVGGYFKSHPHIQPAKVLVDDRKHPATSHLPPVWLRTDEWYCYRAAPDKDLYRILMRLDTASYQGGTMGDWHPIAWCHEFDGGRAFYTGGGHTRESFAEPDFRKHLLGAIKWAAKAEKE